MSAVASPLRGRLTFWSSVTIGGLILFIGLLIIPLGRMILSSMTDVPGDTVLQTYLDFFRYGYYYETLINSLVVSTVATVLATIVGTPLAYLVTRFNIPGKLLVRAAIVLTFVSPPFIGAYAWILLLGRNGVITGGLASLGINMPTIYGMRGIILVFTLQAMPFIFLMVSAGLKTVDQSIEDAATNLGYRPLRVVFSAILPLIVPAISTGALLVFVTSFSDFGTPMIVGENYRVLASLIYTEFINEHGGNPAVASALSLIMLVVTIGALVLQRWYARRRSFGQETVRPLQPRRLTGWRRALATAYVYTVVLAACLPLLTIVVSSFLQTRGPLLTASLTFENYASAVRLPRSLVNTLVFSSIATVLCVVAGGLIAYVVARRRNKLVGALDFFSMVPYAVAGVVLGIALSVTFGGSPFFLAGTATILILAYFIRRLPYSIRSISGMLSQIGTQTEEASVNLGVAPAKTFWKVTVPMVAPAVMSGALLTFATVVREFNSTVILYSGATRTMPVEVFAQVLQGNFASASVVGTVLIVVSLVPIVLLFKFMGKDEEFLV
ncbi:ABC transporter permease [Pseudactinotalea sp. Z1732]|uniref:ABC transporter permease n=1 Tax=Micrococcales TaxID=85006 RepID=UPI003C7B4ACB